jgi:NAD(P)H-flavin reductase
LFQSIILSTIIIYDFLFNVKGNFLSLLKSDNNSSFSCYWSLKNIDDQCLLEHFQIKNVTQHHYHDNDHLDLQPYLVKHLQESNSIFYLAGPFVFVEKLGDWLIQEGISPNKIFSDMKKFI